MPKHKSEEATLKESTSDPILGGVSKDLGENKVEKVDAAKPFSVLKRPVESCSTPGNVNDGVDGWRPATKTFSPSSICISDTSPPPLNTFKSLR